MRFSLQKLAIILFLFLFLLATGCKKELSEQSTQDNQKDSQKIVGKESLPLNQKVPADNQKKSLDNKLKESAEDFGELADDTLNINNEIVMDVEGEPLSQGEMI